MPQNNVSAPKTPELNCLYFYLTSYCNLNCSHCWIAPTYLEKVVAPEEAEFALLKEVIDQALPLGLKSIKITGGEPFLNENIGPLIAYAFSKQLSANIETNATLIDDAWAEFLKENSVKHIAVSLDGPNSTIHEGIRNKPGCFDKAVEGIKSLKRCGLNVQIIMSLCGRNLGYLEETLDLAERYGVDSFKINCISGIARGKAFQNQGATLTVKDYLEIHEKIRSTIGPRHKIKILFDIPPAFKPLRDVKNEAGSCCIKNILGVLADGSISMCGIGNLLSSLKFGHIRENKLRDLWQENAVLKIIRDEMPSKFKGICGRCILKAFCMGKCRAEAYYANNDLLSPFSFCEEAFKAGLFPQGRLFNNKEDSHGQPIIPAK